jgi:transcriptional regulator with XRE-family HTH domain
METPLRKRGRPIGEPAWKTLAELMRQHGYTEEKLADEVKVHRNAVGHWKAGRCHPRPAILLQLVEILKTDWETLLKDAPQLQKIVAE